MILLPLNAVLSNLPLTDIWPNLRDGIVCYTMGEGPSSATTTTTDCSEASKLWLASLAFAFAFNLAMPVSTRYGGAALMWFVRGMAVPVAGLMYSSPAIMGRHATPMGWYQVIGLAVVTIAILLFNAREPIKRISTERT